MARPERIDEVRYQGLELGPEGVAEWVGERRAVFVPRDAIVAIDLQHGVAGERPLFQGLFGGASVLLGVLLLASLAGLYALGDETRASRFAAGGAPLALLGAWLLWSGLRPAYYLRVRTENDVRKLLLPRRIDWPELSAAVYEAQRRFGYRVAWAGDIARPPAPPSVDSAYREAAATEAASPVEPSTTPQPIGARDEDLGVQWGNVLPLGAIFAASCVIGWLFGSPSSNWADRPRTAFASAATMFGESIVAMWILARVVGRSRLSSWRAFAVVWLIVTVIWLFTR